jgi:hypothetical protein
MSTLTLPRATTTSAQAVAVEPDADELFVALCRLSQLARTIDAGETLPVGARRCPSYVPATVPVASERGAWADALSMFMSLSWHLLFVTMATIGVGVTTMQFAPHPARPSLMPSGVAVAGPQR